MSSVIADKHLTLFALESGASVPNQEAYASLMRIDLSHIRPALFFKASPEQFLDLYADQFLIDHADGIKDFLITALIWLTANPQRKLICAGRFMPSEISAMQALAASESLTTSVIHVRNKRALNCQWSDTNVIQVNWTTPNARLNDRLLSAGLPTTNTRQSALNQHAELFQRLVIEDVAPQMRVKSLDDFYRYTKALTDWTGRGLNWASLAQPIALTGPSVRDWTRYLERILVLDLIPPLIAPKPRRSKQRPKLYWNAPGLTLWLSDRVSQPTPEMTTRLIENALYLAIKDACPGAKFSHFLDTNLVEIPLIIEIDGKRTCVFYAHYLSGDSQQEKLKTARRFLLSLVKSNLVQPIAHYVSIDPTSGAIRTELISLSSKEQ